MFNNEIVESLSSGGAVSKRFDLIPTYKIKEEKKEERIKESHTDPCRSCGGFL